MYDRASPLRSTCSNFGGQGWRLLPDVVIDRCALRASNCGVSNSLLYHKESDEDRKVAIDSHSMPLSQTVLRSNGFLRSIWAAALLTGFTV